MIPRHTDESNLRTRTEKQDEEIESPVAEQLCESSAEKSDEFSERLSLLLDDSQVLSSAINVRSSFYVPLSS